jgi:ABC-type Fe3+-hydroxamate transport system substrate-binding protein
MILTSAKHFPQQPPKIVSVVPSQTELLSYFGLDREVIGITKFCVHPEHWFKSKKRVGGTKTLNIDLIKSLQPDLIIANKEENVKEQIGELAKEFNVWVTDVNNLDDGLRMIKDLGQLTHKAKEAKTLITRIKTNFSQLLTVKFRLPAVYLIWQNPYMTIGGDTFISDMMKYCGLQNIFEDKKRYPEIALTDLHVANCQLMLLSSEPYPFKQKHVDELQQRFPGKKIILVDGEMFSWYGSRLLKTSQYFEQLIKVIRQ